MVKSFFMCVCTVQKIVINYYKYFIYKYEWQLQLLVITLSDNLLFQTMFFEYDV